MKNILTTAQMSTKILKKIVKNVKKSKIYCTCQITLKYSVGTYILCNGIYLF